MTTTWWIGRGSSKTVRVQDWLAHGLTEEDVVWDAANGWSVDEATLTSDQIAILAVDSEFRTGQTGPRALPAPSGVPIQTDYRQSAYAYWLAIKELTENFDPGDSTAFAAAVNEFLTANPVVTMLVAGLIDSGIIGRELVQAETKSDARVAIEAQASANPTAVKTNAYNAAPGDLIPADATGGGFTINLPEEPVSPSTIWVKKVDSTANPVTIQRTGSDVFNVSGGPSTVQLTIPGQSVELQYDLGIWYVLAHGTPITSLDARFLKIGDDILGSGGNKVIDLIDVTGGANYLQVENSEAGVTYVKLRAAGVDDNIGFWFFPKGNAAVRIYAPTGQTPTVRAEGVDSVLPLRFIDKAGGFLFYGTTVSDNDIPIVFSGAAANVGANVTLRGTGLFKYKGSEILTAAVLHAQASKTTLVAADEIPIIDSAASNALKKMLWSDLLSQIRGNIVGAAPAALDALDEIAAALGDNPNAITDILTAVGLRVIIGGALGTPSSGTLTNCTGLPVAALIGNIATALTIGTIKLGHASDAILSRTSTGRVGVNTDPIITVQSADTIFSKKVVPRVITTTITSTLTPSGSTSGGDLYSYQSLSQDLVIAAPIGTASDGILMRYRFRDNGTPRALTWNAIFRPIGVTGYTTTTANKIMIIDTIYNSADTKWDIVDVKQET